MCPTCITTASLVVASAAATGGLAALIRKTLRIAEKNNAATTATEKGLDEESNQR